MKTRIKKLSLATAAFVTGAFLTTALSTPATAAILIDDGFANIGTNGYVSGYISTSPHYNASVMNRASVLAGTDNTGLANNYWIFSGANYAEISKQLISWRSDTYIQGAIGIGSTTSGILDVTAVYELQSSKGTGDPAWGAVGFLASTAVSSWTSASGGSLLSASLSPGGSWSLYENGAGSSGTLLASGSLTPFDVDSTISLSLKYNTEAGTAALFVDGENVSGWFSTSIVASAITASGYYVEPTAGMDPRAFYIDDFSVSANAIPEPGVAILAALSALPFLARRRSVTPLR